MVRDSVWIEELPTDLPALIDNDLYEYLKIGENMESIATGQSALTDVFTEGEPETD